MRDTRQCPNNLNVASKTLNNVKTSKLLLSFHSILNA